MGLRRIAAGDQRRRRVLIEERLNLVGVEGEPDSERQPTAKAGTVDGHSYSHAASLSLQSPSVAILAARPFTQLVLSLSCLAAIVGLLAVYGHWRLLPTGTWQSYFSCLDVQRTGSLATWICSLMLCVAAFQGIQIYRLRRHKTDDYRGRYRVWAWFPGILLATALSVATGVHRELTALLVGSLWHDAPQEYMAMLPLGALGLWLLVAARLTFELRPNRWSLGSLAAATAGYLGGVIVAQIEVQPVSRMLVDLISSTLVMAGHLGVFVAVMTFGRHVYLDSQGLLPARAAKPRRARSRVRGTPVETTRTRRKATGEASPESPPPQAEPERAEPAPEIPAPAPVLRLGSRAEDAAEEDEDDEESSVASSGERLSKTDRRRLKKQRRQEQLRRAA